MLLANSPSPMTLEDRGLAVPFTTPMLASCRVRRDYRDRLEILVPSLVDGRGLYVIPWAMLPEAAALTLHDRILHEEISKPIPLSPRTVREASLTVAESGLAGPAAASAARATRERDAAHLARMETTLEQLAATATRRTLRRKALDGDAAAAPAIALTRRHAEILATIGLHDAAPPGRLRQVAIDISDFFVTVDRWIDATETEEARLGQFCGEVANHTRERCAVYFSEFDHLMERLGRDAEGWPETLEALERVADRVSWLVDGWKFPLEWWRDSQTEDREAQSLALFGIFRILPIVPVAEAIRPQPKHRIRMGTVQRRWARLLEDWQTGQDDTEMIVRIERFRAHAA